MDAGTAAFAVIMSGMGIVGWLINKWLVTRSTRRAPADAIAATRQVELLSNENAGLKGQVGRLEDRIAVLERIVTDPAAHTAREIEALR